MNVTMNNTPAPAPAPGVAAANGALTAVHTGAVAGTGNGTINSAIAADGLPLDPALAAALSNAQAPLAFLQFMQVEPQEAPETMPQPELAAELPDGAVPAAGPAADAQDERAEAGDAGEPQLAVMSMPMTPAMMSMPAALPAAMRLMAGMPERRGRGADAAPLSAAAATATTFAAGAGTPELPRTASAGSPPPPASVLPTQGGDAATAALVRASAAVQPPQPAAAAQAGAAQARDAAVADTQPATAGSVTGSAGFGVAAPAAPALAARDGGSLALSGPPTAWRQSLQEALGERLSLQLGKNAEQAVIRLEPPMLGRVEISIRHAAGSLEVNISATHGEVLRQLNTVSESLRNDLAQRQYLDVSVNVSQAPARAQAAAQAGTGFGTDAQGRGREQGQGQDQDERAPGAALAEANQSNNAFSLGARA